jgi:pimeloyl-ACP methyl ester carboxylesterase
VKTTSEEPPLKPPGTRAATLPRVIALLLAVGTLLALAYPELSKAPPLAVPPGTHAGQLINLKPCTFPTEDGGYAADCGTVVVPENRSNPRSRLIALPVTRIRARSPHPLEPIFYFNGGPGQSNMKFPEASRLAAQHDVVLVGYRGVDGSSVLNCPEVTAEVASSADLLATASLRAYSQAFTTCAQRLERSGVDLAGYSLTEQADDVEAARRALGYQRINLLSESAGTRLAMIYAWRYPASVGRSAMIGVNPPGNFVYNGDLIDQELEEYSALCARDSSCRARTSDLAASLRQTAAAMPDRWLFLPIKPGNVKVATFLALTETIAQGLPLTGPVTLNSWLSAAAGDPSGFWLLSVLGGLILPTSFNWGEFASVGQVDAPAAARYFASGRAQGSIIGNPATEFLWGGGGLPAAWPANPSQDQYASVRKSDAPTLLIGGTLDFETPAQNATKELLPYLPNGHQVVLSDLGHAADFWAYEPDASTHLLTTFYDTGQVDTSRYTQHAITFKTVTFSLIAKILLAVMLGLAVLAVASLLLVALRVRKRGAAGRKTSLLFRSAGAFLVGLGGWFLGALITLTCWNTVPLTSEPLAIAASGGPVALSLYLAWTHRGWSRAAKAGGLLTASAGALLGGWYGYTVIPGLLGLFVTSVGAIAAGNIALIALGLWREHRLTRAGA